MNEPPNILDIFMSYVEAVKQDFFAYGTAGAGIALVMLPYSVGMVFVVYLAMGFGMVPGIVMEDENVLFLGMILTPTILIFALTALVNLVTIPMHASMLRAIWAHVEGDTEAKLGPAACFSTYTQEPGRPLLYMVVQMVVYGVLAMFCLLPGIAFLAAADMAWPLVVLEGLSPVEAIRRSARHFSQHLAWHLGYALILFSMVFVLAYIPFVGAFLSPGLVGGFRVFAYRAVRSDLVAA
ncbi:MAG: hypothetical protein H6737_30695 [Alphaproteobacteria bacterium]|nr:hypothetical protein [Alphaproteobacteria bacterium]